MRIVSSFWPLMMGSTFISFVVGVVIAVKIGLVLGIVAYFIVNMLCTAYLMMRSMKEIDRENNNAKQG